MAMLLLFTVAFGSAGCGGGGSSSNVEEQPNNPAPNPEPDPTPMPNPDPTPTPSPTIYTVTFDSNGGSYVPSQNIQEPSAPSKEGFIFSGWYSNQSLTTIFDFTSLIISNITLYAKWLPTTKENYTVIFDSDGGSSIVQQVIKAGKCASEPDIPTKKNYLFIGWYMKKEFSFMFDFSTPITEDITLYAKWYSENSTLDSDGDGLTDELELLWVQIHTL